MKIYVASSWRNLVQPAVVQMLRAEGHEVFDFKDPGNNGNSGFHWSEIDKAWKQWSPEEFRECLEHPLAKHGFKCDFEAMVWAEACLLVMPCGRSAHLELGWAIGAGKPTAIYLADGEPELMYGMAGKLVIGAKEMLEWAAEVNT